MYNLVNVNTLYSSTVSGVSTRALTQTELEILYDTDTTSTYVSLTSSDVVVIDVNLSNRIRAEQFKLYISTVDFDDALTKVEFYYKNNIADSLILCSKAHDNETMFPINLPSIFAPVFLRLIITNLECDIYELILTNNTSEIAFGINGENPLVFVDTNDLGYTVLPIFNNNNIATKPMTAYVTVDKQGDISDSYIKLSDNCNGPYYDINDNILLQDDKLTSTYRWSQGQFENTLCKSDSVVIGYLSYDNIGYYTSPVIYLGDKLLSSYLVTDIDNRYNTFITYDSTHIKNTVKVRSSEIAPLSFTKLFIPLIQASKVYVIVGDLSTGLMVLDYVSDGTVVTKMMFDVNRSSYIILCNNKFLSCKFKYDTVDKRTIISSVADRVFESQYIWDIDIDGNVWGYSSASGSYVLYVLFSGFSSYKVLIDNGNSSFLISLAANKLYNNCWYTDSSSKELVQIDISGIIINTIPLSNPSHVCSLMDGGCLVVDKGYSSIYNYSYTATLLKTITYDSSKEVAAISYGTNGMFNETRYNYFWLLMTDGFVLQYTLDGTLISSTQIIGASSIHAFIGGCLVHHITMNKTYQLDKNGTVERVWSYSGLGSMGAGPCPVYVTYSEFLRLTFSQAILPLHDDPMWGDDHDNGWSLVDSTDYILPYNTYHQFKYKLFSKLITVPIMNASAELGTHDGWFNELTTIDPNCAKVAYKHSGTYSFTAYSPNHYYDAGYGLDMQLSQVIDLSTISGVDFTIIDECGGIEEDGYDFFLSAWCYSKVTNTTYGNVSFKYYDENNQYLQNTTYMSDNVDVNYWKQATVSAKILSGTRYIKVSLYSESAGWSNHTYIDDVEASITYSPKLNYVNIVKPVKITDIQPQTYKYLYLKKNIPTTAEIKEYETKLKCWWGN